MLLRLSTIHMDRYSKKKKDDLVDDNDIGDIAELVLFSGSTVEYLFLGYGGEFD